MSQFPSTISSTIPPTYPTSMALNPARRTANSNVGSISRTRMSQCSRQCAHTSSSGRSARQALHAGYTSTSNTIPTCDYNAGGYYPINTARPSMAGWWRCCQCGGDNNPAYEMGRCVLCGHYACPYCAPLGWSFSTLSFCSSGAVWFDLVIILRSVLLLGIGGGYI